jgi:hypothetical protein
MIVKEVCGLLLIGSSLLYGEPLGLSSLYSRLAKSPHGFCMRIERWTLTLLQADALTT